MMRVEQLECVLGGKRILQGVTASFPLGRVTGVVGRNGCGKSTLLSYLSRMREVPQKVFWDDLDVTTIPMETWARHVASLAQDTHYQYPLSVLDVAVMGRFPYISSWRGYTEEDYQRAEEALALLGVDHLAAQNVQTVSGGERQRVAIAKLFVQDTPVILLDEPTNHLDAQHTLALLRLLRRSGKTVVVVLHDLSLARQYCDHIVLLEQGRVVAEGAPEAVLTPAVLNPIFQVDFVQYTLDGKTWLQYT